MFLSPARALAGERNMRSRHYSANVALAMMLR